MKRQVLVFARPRSVSAVAEALPGPAAGQVLVRTVVSAISAGTELLIYRGQAPVELPADETIAALAGSLAFPLRYGYAAVGHVTAGGDGVDPAWIGQLVFAFQPHASHFVAAVEDVLPVPPDLTAEEAALLPTMETAVNLLLDGAPLVGEQVLVFGQGVVGLLTTALLARLPLASLVTADTIARRRELGLGLGARVSLDPGTADFLEAARAALQGERPGGGADLAYELSGNPAALDQAIAATGYGGRVVIGSWYGRKRVELDLGGSFHRSHMLLIASQVSRVAPALSGRWNSRRRLGVAWEMLRLVRPAHLITHRYPIERAADAYALLDTCPEQALQVLLTY